MSVKTLKNNIPSRLFPGDTIAIIAPSSPFDQEKFKAGLHVLEELGFELIIPEDIFKSDRYLAGPDSTRAGILNAVFDDPEIKGVFCARGGYGALRILSLIDYDAITLNPKVFIGCSDVSAILNVLWHRSSLVTFHGPMIESLGKADDKTKESLKDIFFEENLLEIRPEDSITIQPGCSSGRVSGGNLSTICHLVGTPFEPDFSGHILFVEDVGEAPYRIDRMLTHMKMAGCFDNITGIFLGSFKNCGESDQIHQIFSGVFAEYNIPVLAGFNIGHDEPNLTIPFGLNATLDTENGLLSYHEYHFV